MYGGSDRDWVVTGAILVCGGILIGAAIVALVWWIAT